MSLMQAYELSLHNRPGDGRCGAFDAHVLAKYNDHWITSPSAEYVPQPFIFEGARVEPLRDGWFGHIDCFQWPQLHAERYVWSACIPRKLAYRDDPTWKWLWWNVTQSAEDFVLEGGSAFKVGRIHADKWKLLETAYNQLDARAQDWIQKNPRYDGPLRVDAWLRSCRRSLLRLKQLPFTFRDTVLIVAFCQCLCLDVFGMLDYLQTVLPPADGTFIDGFDHWIGAFTMDPEECQRLFESRIPVWLIWKPDCVPADMKVIKEVEVTCLDDIVTDPEEFEVGQVLKWKGGWCYPGDARHLHTRDTPVIGLEQFTRPWPEPSVRSNNGATASTPSSASPAASNAASSSGENSSTGAVRTERSRQRTKPYRPVGLTPRAKPAVILNPDLWEDINDPAIPPVMSAWHAALKDVVKDVKRVRPNAPKVAYFFPNPVLFVRGESSDHRQRYMRNWLVSRAGWISCLSASDVSPVSPRSWRDFLNTIPERFSATFSGEQQREAAAFFGPELIRVQHDIPSHVQFRDLSICIADLASIDQLTKSKILWDLYKHNFQFELVALGRVLMPGSSSNREPEWLDLVRQLFPGDSELTMCAEPFLTQNQGLGSSDPRSRCEFVEIFRKLLASWPGFPSDLVAPLLPSTPLTRVWAVERRLAIFYVQSFFDNFGRPPILPRLIPVPLACGPNGH
ncbi:hypothetical protein BKA83DRAFT_4497344 [Pisolithus microcarpus]|nr:hypothetical protein BKA83DRAFT_4497344 [Pisolithus microcarpus]